MKRGSNVVPLVLPDRNATFQRLLNDVLERNRHPQGRYEIAATIESMGWNDQRVYEMFGTEDVFALAEEMWSVIEQKILFATFAKPTKPHALVLLWEMVRQFLRGLIYALPMAISVLSMLTLKFSLWSYEHLSVELATCIAIGTILSFLTVGGFTQAIARRGYFYLQLGYYNMGRKMTFSFIRMGYLTSIVVFLAVYLFNLVFLIFSHEMMLVVLLYFFFLNSIWLSVTVMYILRKELTFTGLIVLGIALVYLLFRVFGLDILFAQLISMTLVALVGLVLVLYFFKQEERKEEKGIAPRMPRLGVTIYSVLPYFLYGFLYFLLLYVDRVMAWSTNGEFMPYLIWFRGEYELGLDFALLVLMIPLGVSEVLVHQLMVSLEASQKSFWGFETAKMGQKFVREYQRMLWIISGTSLFSGVVVYVGITFADGKYEAATGHPLLGSEVTVAVFICSILAYAVLAVALMNAVVLFSLSQPRLVNRAIWPAVIADVIVGFVLTRWIEYGYAAAGLLVGTLVFVYLSTREVRRVLKNVDYYLYAIS
ncbi:MAG TPA: hypothetical protein VFV52_08740 [Bacilli bacterium]|nr:hypothetical protein [Bacilli bacterium]